ncbi:DUF899 domain-containing protein [Candidatus Solirubrobacter pratensis]|uniref:DUF899 domain-containing protein n=1 Tax=Candidatus Solirubrobacter pratensis TaxID=1298857 RepID=UPI000404C7BB|nr:DUF899 domain-containing protein [Candidatus Solirubrobacter pratensis]
MTTHATGTPEEHLAARLSLLEEEKELTRRGDELARRRRELPWVRVQEPYRFSTPDGERTLAELFDGRSQLLVYHFMLGPEWSAGCPACSFWADGFDGVTVHLNQRDVTMVCVSRAPLTAIEAYKRRMGWRLDWVSSLDSDFNADFGVSFPPGAGGAHNFTQPPHGEEHAGLSAFVAEDDAIYHAYSCYARGLDAFNVGYQLLDRAPRGRGEDGVQPSHAWLKRHDEYAPVR